MWVVITPGLYYALTMWSTSRIMSHTFFTCSGKSFRQIRKMNGPKIENRERLCITLERNPSSMQLFNKCE